MESPQAIDIDEHKFPAALRQAIGFRKVISLDQVGKTSKIEFEARPEFTHSGGTTVQGGIIAAWIDHAMAWAVHAHDPACSVASLELKTTYIARAQPGRIVVEARAIKIGRTAAFLEARVLGEDGETLATASSSGLVMKKQG